MSDVRQVFKTFMEDALLKSLPDAELAPAADEAPLPADLMHALLPFEGPQMKAEAYLGCSRAFLLKTCPLAIADIKESDAVLRDWLGELGNLTMGRLKNRLLAHGVTIKISPPVLATNGPAPLAKASKEVELTNRYKAGGELVVFLCRITGEVPVVGEALKQSAEILPGDAIYRLNDSTNQNAAPNYDRVSHIRSGQAQDAEDRDDEIDDDSEDTESYFAADRAADSRPQPAKPVRILYHSQLKEPVLGGISWPEIDRLVLQFSTGLDITLSPPSLLAKGLSTFTIEGLTMSLEREGRLLKISFPKLHIHLSKLD